LTTVFISNSADNGTGWAAQAACGNAAQPYVPHMLAYINGQGENALNPADTGFVDVCFGDSILFVANPDVSNGFEANGFGYSQHVDSTLNFIWNVNGNVLDNNDSVWFTPPARSGYLVDLQVQDNFPQIEGLFCAVRVSQLPSFAGTGPVEDTICLDSETQLLGGVTSTDTVGVDIPEGSFDLGGSFAGLTYLPDGDGAEYETDIEITGFPSGSVIANPEDLNQVCLTMEHTYMGDLEIWLECPSGTNVILFDGFNGGEFPGGGSGGGGTFLGDPIDNTTPGENGDGWEYCFSSAFNDVGLMSDMNAAGGANHITLTDPPNNWNGTSMNPDQVYQPEDDFGLFAGCPLNGTWTIHVQDNIGADDGYIFQWGLFFDASFFGDLGSYQNTVTHDFWSPNDAIISQVDTITGQTDTVLTVRPNQPGDYEFTYNVIDDFGCLYDTTVSLFVIDAPKILNDTSVCDYNIQILGTESFDGGVWTVDTSYINLSDSLIDNPSAWADSGGVYMFIYTDNECGFKDTAEINFIVSPYGQIAADPEFCEGSELTLGAWSPDGYVDSYLWSTGETGVDIVITEPGEYSVQYINECGVYHDTVNVATKICDIKPPNVITPNNDGFNDIWFVKSEGVKEFYCEIRNRWGNVVYSYTDPAGGWDGKSKAGQVVAQGVYFYYIQALSDGDQEIVQQGAITVKY
jgi:gliding motility-associated-like protein